MLDSVMEFQQELKDVMDDIALTHNIFKGLFEYLVDLFMNHVQSRSCKICKICALHIC